MSESKKEPIHSGHFMTSKIHSDYQNEEDDEDVEVDVVDIDENDKSPLVEKGRTDTDEKPVTFYKFGPQKTQSIAIDVSLNKLNKCIRIAYMKMTTPKWKDFKGLKLQWKHRIRLNNVIWRAFYMEFRKPDRKKRTCYFSVPDDDNTHAKIEGTVLEGMYWKRRMEGVCAQYKSWRSFNRSHVKKKSKNCCRKRENSCGCNPDQAQMVPWFQPTHSQTPKPVGCDYEFDEFDNEFTDALFSSLNEPFLFPNPKESMQSGNADIIQPGLLSLQPSIEEILMSDFQFHDFTSKRYFQSQDEYGFEPIDSPRTPIALPAPPQSSSQRQSSQQQQQHQQASSLQQQQQMQNAYTTREYDAAHMLVNYSNQQPRQRYSSEPTLSEAPSRQTPSVPPANIQPLFSVAVQPIFSQAQPLYSQAVYEQRTQPNLITGRNLYTEAQNTVQNGQPFFDRLRQPMTPGANDYVPQILAAAGISSGSTMTSLTSVGPTFSMSTTAPFHNNLGFRSQPGTTANIVSPTQPQQTQQIPQWWSSIQQQPTQQIQYQQQDRRTFQTLQNVQPVSLQSPDATSTNPPVFRQQLPQTQGLVPTQLLNLQQPQPQLQQKVPTRDANLQYSSSLNLSQYLTPQSAQQIQSSLTNILANNTSPFYANPNATSPLDERTTMPPPKLPRHSQEVRGATKDSNNLYNNTRNLISIAALGSTIAVSGLQKAEDSGISLFKPPQTTLQNTSILLSPTESFAAQKCPPGTSGVLQRRSSLTTALTTPLEDEIATQQYIEKRSPPPPLETTPISPDQPSGSRFLDMPIKSESPFSGASAIVEDRKKPLIPAGSKRRLKSAPADSTLHPEERKRILHLHAEKNRRSALKDGFDQLLNSIPVIEEAGIKATNAVVLNHAAQHIRSLKDEQDSRNREIDAMKEKINNINSKISLLQSNLPSNRRASSSNSTPTMQTQIEQFYERYTKERSRRDYRFWLMAQMMRPLISSYAAEIHPEQRSSEQVLMSAREWINRHWNAAELRPLASEMLLYLATETGALTNPNALSEHIMKEINKPT